MFDDVYQLYLTELNAITPCHQEEAQELLIQLTQGDEQAKIRLSEGYLHKALQLAESYQDSGLPINDLIQEANIALTCTVNECQQLGREISLTEFCAKLDQNITTAIQDAVEENQELLKQEEEMVAKVNVLGIVSQKLAADLGREATIAELAQKMKLSEAEIRDLMKWTLDALSPDEEQI